MKSALNSLSASELREWANFLREVNSAYTKAQELDGSQDLKEINQALDWLGLVLFRMFDWTYEKDKAFRSVWDQKQKEYTELKKEMRSNFEENL